MKFAVSSLLIGSSLLMAGCAVYPDGTPAYANGGYGAPAPAPVYQQAYPGGYAPGGYYDAPVAVVQPSIVIDSGGGYGNYYGGRDRYYNDGRNYHQGDRGGYNGDRGQNRGGQGPQGGPPGRGGPQQNAGGPGSQGGHGGPQQNSPQGRPPAAAPQQQARGNTPYVGKSNWGKPAATQYEHEH